MEGAARPRPEHLVVGRITKPHGIKGEAVVQPLTDRPDAVFAEGRALLLGDADGELGASAQSLHIERARPHKRGWLLKFASVPDRTAAERLAKRCLLVAIGDVEPPAEDELFYHELLGLEVVTEAGEEVGRVREIYEAAPTHLLEVESEEKTHLIPFAEAVVREINLDAGRLTIAPPPGLLEI